MGRSLYLPDYCVIVYIEFYKLTSTKVCLKSELLAGLQTTRDISKHMVAGLPAIRGRAKHCMPVFRPINRVQRVSFLDVVLYGVFYGIPEVVDGFQMDLGIIFVCFIKDDLGRNILFH